MNRPFPDVDRRTDEILARDFLYEDPASFRAGVLAALRMMAEQQAEVDSDRSSHDRRAGA